MDLFSGLKIGIEVPFDKISFPELEIPASVEVLAPVPALVESIVLIVVLVCSFSAPLPFILAERVFGMGFLVGICLVQVLLLIQILEIAFWV